MTYAARNFQYFLDTQPPGSLRMMSNPDIDVRDSETYMRSLAILQAAEPAFEASDGGVCPYLVLLRGEVAGFPGGQCPCKVSGEVIARLNHVGILSVDIDKGLELTDALLDRLQGRISGRLIPNWNKP